MPLHLWMCGCAVLWNTASSTWITIPSCKAASPATPGSLMTPRTGQWTQTCERIHTYTHTLYRSNLQTAILLCSVAGFASEEVEVEEEVFFFQFTVMTVVVWCVCVIGVFLWAGCRHRRASEWNVGASASWSSSRTPWGGGSSWPTWRKSLVVREGHRSARLVSWWLS